MPAAKFKLQCQACGALLVAQARMAGKAAKCPKCNAALEILGPEQYRSANIVKRGEPTRHSENSTANRRPLIMAVGLNAIVTLVILSAWIFFFSDLRSEPTVDKLRIAKKREHAASTLSPSSGVSAGSAEINDRDKEVVQATPILEDPPVGESIVAVSTGRASTSPTEDHSERVRPDNQLHSGATQNVDKSVVLVQVGASSGSGFFVDDSGIIATAYHVIEGAESVVVHLPNGVKLESPGWIALDTTRDLAAIACPSASGWSSPLELRTNVPDKAESVFAYGAPLGLEGTVSDGIVSGIRTDRLADQFGLASDTILIQTTAPISPGNSGGPLVDRTGSVVGVNSLVVTTGQNLNFAIASAHLAKILKDGDSASQIRPWSALPPARPKRVEEKNPDADRIIAKLEEIRDAQEQLADSEYVQEQNERGIALVADLKRKVAVVRNEGERLTRQREQVMAEAASLMTRGRTLENQGASLNDELAHVRLRLDMALINRLSANVVAHREKIARLELELATLRREYRAVEARLVQLDRQARSLLDQIDERAIERDNLYKQITLAEESTPALQTVLPPGLPPLTEAEEFQLRVTLRGLGPAHRQRHLRKLIEKQQRLEERLRSQRTAQ